MPNIFRYANPREFMRLSAALLPYTAAASVVAIAVGLFMSLTAPPDYQQGMTVTIMFIHVPAAIMAESVYGLIAVTSLFSLVWRHPLSDVAARAAAPFGALFTALGLITGSLWGRPMWGAYWVWDARLTSFLILLFLYLGYMALWNAIEDEIRAARAAAILALIGAVNLPIIVYSVEWWNTLHQGESIISGKLAPVFLWPLLVMWAGYGFLFLTLWMLRIRTEILNRRARTLMQEGA
ncbi:MAG TPA: heme ABC transporter permease CcmC [Rhizomicrobium sp.]|jgi:heme exporter protein C|nr:heme ABC transporter permease CcmC [Rhizomicrobium sp.]